MSEQKINIKPEIVEQKQKGKIIYATDHARQTGFGKVADNICKAWDGDFEVRNLSVEKTMSCYLVVMVNLAKMF
jgi:hypothetical protein